MSIQILKTINQHVGSYLCSMYKISLLISQLKQFVTASTNVCQSLLPTFNQQLWKLLAFTTKAPFYDHDGNAYILTNEINLGNSLHPAFSKFLVSNVENYSKQTNNTSTQGMLKTCFEV